MIRVLNVNDSDHLNRAFNGLDLIPWLEKEGVESQMAVWDRRIDGSSPIGPPMFQHIPFEPFTWGLPFRSPFRGMDVVHYHLVQNANISPEALRFLAAFKPSVLTLHDLWAFTGGCPAPYYCDKWMTGCMSCLRYKNAHDAWLKKEKYIGKADLTLIVPSRWMKAQVEASPIFEGREVHIIPFGVFNPISAFYPRDERMARDILGLSRSRFIITYRDSPDPRKGADLARGAIASLPSRVAERVEVIRFGSSGLGWLAPHHLALLMNAANIVLCPSRCESFCLVAGQSMVSGTPTVITSGTAMSELPNGGWMTVPQTVDGVRDGIIDTYELYPEAEACAEWTLGRMERDFHIRGQAEKTAEIYRSLMT